jgi:thiol-disulfide isomerase/thioredoxin
MKRFLLQLSLVICHFAICVLGGAFGWQNQLLIVSIITIVSFELLNKVLKTKTGYSLLFLTPFFLFFTLAIYLIPESVKSTYAIGFWGLFLLVLASVFNLWKRKNSILLYCCYLVFIFLGYYIVWPNSESYISIEKNEHFNLKNADIINEKGELIDWSSFKGKVVLFDIWHSKCAVCFQKFPELESLKEYYKSNSNVEIIALNMPLNVDSAKYRSDMISNYTFKKMYFKNPEEVLKIPIKSAPQVIILDKKMSTHFVGQLNIKWYYLVGNPKKIINKLL